eukprot:gene24692-31065_t
MESINKELVEASRDGVVERVKELLLVSGVDVNYQGYNERQQNAALHWASINNHTEVAELLLLAGADPNLRNRNKKTPLHQAAEHNCPGAAQHLVAHKADINALNRWKQTPLHEAAVKGHHEVVTVLLTAKANTKLLNNNKDTPLHLAASYSHTETVTLLLVAGANTHIVNELEQTPLHVAGTAEIAKLLIDAGAEVDSVDKDLETALHYAARKGHIEFVQLLLGAGADVYLINKDEFSAYDLAQDAAIMELLKTYEVITSLNAHNAHVDSKQLKPEELEAKPTISWTPADAANKIHLDTINRELIEVCKEGTNLDRINELLSTPEIDIYYHSVARDQNTCLHWAAKNNHVAVVKLLLAKGANSHIRNRNKKTPLHQAVEEGHLEVVNLLIEGGGDVNAVNRWKQTALHEASIRGFTAIVEALLAEHAKVDAVNSKKETPLHLAASFGHTDIVKLLLSAGAHVKLANELLQTPLHIAANVEVVTLLLEAGADPDAVDKDLETPLHYEAQKGREDCVRLLLERGADIYLINKNEFSAFDLAKNPSIMDLIKAAGLTRGEKTREVAPLPPAELVTLRSRAFSGEQVDISCLQAENKRLMQQIASLHAASDVQQQSLEKAENALAYTKTQLKKVGELYEQLFGNLQLSSENRTLIFSRIDKFLTEHPDYDMTQIDIFGNHGEGVDSPRASNVGVFETESDKKGVDGADGVSGGGVGGGNKRADGKKCVIC